MVSKTEPNTKPSKSTFTPEVVFGLMLYNEHYDNTPYLNLRNSVIDAEIVRHTFKDLRIPDKNITFLKDGNWDEVDMLLT
jgi:hypothetical protein